SCVSQWRKKARPQSETAAEASETETGPAELNAGTNKGRSGSGPKNVPPPMPVPAAQSVRSPPRNARRAAKAERSGGHEEPKAGMGAKAPRKKRVARSYTPSEKARALEHAAENGVSAASREHGPSR